MKFITVFKKVPKGYIGFVEALPSATCPKPIFFVSLQLVILKIL